jgi:hypothetical protein
MSLVLLPENEKRVYLCVMQTRVLFLVLVQTEKEIYLLCSSVLEC